MAATIIITFVILGGLLRFSDDSTSQINEIKFESQAVQGIASNILLPVVGLPLSVDAPEKDWTDALAKKINGQSEVKVDLGRVDVMTDSYAIEIDFLKKWHEGLGQAIHYGDDSIRIGVLALIDKDKAYEDLEQMKLLKKIERLCIKKGVKLVLLRSVYESSLQN